MFSVYLSFTNETHVKGDPAVPENNYKVFSILAILLVSGMKKLIQCDLETWVAGLLLKSTRPLYGSVTLI